ncbi:MAG: hypothetical protein A2X78_03295 [Gammaproteobacteria bacterium GWE2_37_16]|nr:MAG: hypothetical protein A2X78_03295 [Gammaproteobacteria bacterium GWE2_37_16]
MNVKYSIKNLKFPILLLLGILSSSQAFAISPFTQLKQLIGKIHILQSNLTQTQKQQVAVQQQLQQSEVAIGSVALAAKQTNKKLTEQQMVLQKLNLQKVGYQKQLQEQKQHAFHEVRAAYMLDHDGYFKMLFNQENPNDVDRLSVYFRYLLAARAESIHAVVVTLQKLQQNNDAIQKQTHILKGLYLHQETEKQQLERKRQERNLALHSIKSSLQDQNAKMQHLLADKAALEQVIVRITEEIKARERAQALERARKHLPVASLPLGGKFLGNLRGKLLSPTSGKIENAGGGEARLGGVIVAAGEGQEVHAIAAGRVVFAEWLRGYGLMLIIDHGRGYMSLYGRNHSLYKKTNDTVAAGEVIATVGNSGGYEKSGLYFAMRYNGKPIDPTVWCKF